MRHDTGNKEKGTTLKEQVMLAIREHRVEPRPRAYFVLYTLAAALLAFVLAACLLYVASLALFISREQGLLVVPAFGWRGVTVLMYSLPWLVIALFLVLGILFGSVIRRFAQLHRRPFLVSFVAVALLALIGGFLLSKTPTHRRIERHVRDGSLPHIFGIGYREPFRTKHAPDAYVGTIITTTPDGFLTRLEEGDRLVYVVIERRTMLPDGSEFSVGERVMTIGDVVATDTLRAVGVRVMDSDW
ncbi:DUF4175 domain-containing protein [Candidatus Kaiserbacteria bacterium]|nr:DUF4175 domain-containing protein [Candidatus Kaiserbacteria bacterium]